MNIIQSMYNNTEPNVKFNNVLSDDFSTHLVLDAGGGGGGGRGVFISFFILHALE